MEVRTASCPGCGLPYGKTPLHIIDTPGNDLIPYCETCNRRLTLGAKKSYITSLLNSWRHASEIDHDTIWQIALDTVDWEHFLWLGGKKATR